jgi:hypothetical protein
MTNEHLVAPDRRLPEPIRRYLARNLPDDRSAPRRVRITQEGEMWQKPGARAMRFTALEEFAVETVALAWRARFPLLPLIAMKVADEYANGDGHLVARLLGIPLMRKSGPETSIGEALRYLAELPWSPQAIAANGELEWRQLEGDSVEVATAVAAQGAAVRFQFDRAGDIVRASCDTRPRPVGKTFVATPWSGTFADYKVLGQTRIPTWAEVSWDLPEGPFVYWRGRVTSLELVAAE